MITCESGAHKPFRNGHRRPDYSPPSHGLPPHPDTRLLDASPVAPDEAVQ